MRAVQSSEYSIWHPETLFQKSVSLFWQIAVSVADFFSSVFEIEAIILASFETYN